MGKPSQTSNRYPLPRRCAALAACAGAVLMSAPALAEAPQARTSDEASQANLQGAILAPLRDVNLMKDEVPQVLTGAQEAPYLNPEEATCAQLASMIAPLEAALGPDKGDGAEARKTGASTMVFGAVADVTRDVIPFRGVVRRITGAARQDQKVRDAREAGQLRRAYLKGFASAKGCYGAPAPDDGAPTQIATAPLTPPPVPQQPEPVAVAALEAPAPVQVAASPQAPPAQPSPQFNLPESWRAQIKSIAY